MSVRTKKIWLAWLLPLFVLRAFVPAGFMLSWAGNELQVVVCSGSGPVMPAAVASQQDMHGEHAHHVHEAAPTADHAQHQHQGSEAHEGSYCPFAIAGSPSLATALYAFASELPPTQTFDLASRPQLESAPILIDRIRGPPFV